MTRLDSPSIRLIAGASAVAAAWYAARRLSRTEYSFRNRTVVVTGGTRGLGFAMARRFADEGGRVWLVARSTEELGRAADELIARGGWVRTIPADIRRPDHVSRIIDTVVATDGRLDVLVNNAGIIEVGPVEHSKLEDFQDALATHFWGPLDLIRASLPHMKRKGEGRIVNISSIGGRVAIPHLAAYTASKFALVGLSEALRAELLKEGVLVTTVTPGLMRTGSYVNVKLRGRHADELRWFSAMSSTPLTAMNTERAAKSILEACREGRATLTPGVQAKLTILLNALAPNLFAFINAAVDRTLLPRPDATPLGDAARRGVQVDPGKVKTVLSEKTRREYHQPEPAWS
jgi:NAD(P)-dependent dehydrogenase (short-subunit alcohol dehydrogenase family)